jgi:hypothetical protein
LLKDGHEAVSIDNYSTGKRILYRTNSNW